MSRLRAFLCACAVVGVASGCWPVADGSESPTSSPTVVTGASLEETPDLGDALGATIVEVAAAAPSAPPVPGTDEREGADDGSASTPDKTSPPPADDPDPAETTPPPPASDHPDGVNLGSKISTASVCAEINEYRSEDPNLLPYIADHMVLQCQNSAAIDALIARTLEPPAGGFHGQGLADAIFNGDPAASMFGRFSSIQQIGDGGLAGGSFSGWFLYEEAERTALVGCWNVFWWDATANAQTDAYISCAFDLAS